MLFTEVFVFDIFPGCPPRILSSEVGNQGTNADRAVHDGYCDDTTMMMMMMVMAMSEHNVFVLWADDDQWSRVAES